MFTILTKKSFKIENSHQNWEVDEFFVQEFSDFIRNIRQKIEKKKNKQKQKSKKKANFIVIF
jgi:hypothetical protein